MRLEFYISVLAALVSILSAFFSIVVYFSGLRRQKKQATLDAYNVLQREALDVLNKYTKKQISEISESSRSEEYKSLSSLLARCEHFSVGVNTGIYDLKTLKQLAGGYFDSLYDKLSPLVDRKRIIGGANDYYKNFELLAQKIKGKGNRRTT